MKTIDELNPHGYPVSKTAEQNLATLFDRLIDAQAAYMNDGGTEFVITSGLRSEAQQAHLISIGKTNAKHSKHLAGAAADVFDHDGKLAAWVMDNIDYMVRIGLWMEDFKHTKGWVHFQMMAPGSGNRVFIP